MWQILLYGFFAVIALRSLFTLMEQHRRGHLYFLKDQAKKEAEKQAALKAEQEQQAAEAEAKAKVEAEQQNQAA